MSDEQPEQAGDLAHLEQPNGNSPGLSAEDERELELLVETLPGRIAEQLREIGLDGLTEVVLDLGRVPRARYTTGERVLSEDEVTEQELEAVVAQVSEFGDDNRAGVPRTLHRISAIRNRRGRIVGLTCRATWWSRGTAFCSSGGPASARRRCCARSRARWPTT